MNFTFFDNYDDAVCYRDYESIKHLDGDIYQLFNGQYIDISRVIQVSKVRGGVDLDNPDTYSNLHYAYEITLQLHNTNILVLGPAIINQRPIKWDEEAVKLQTENQEKSESEMIRLRDEFIAVWKQFKKDKV